MFTYYKTYKELGKKINGFEYVDLGLPSGTLWATCNVVAKKPSDAGLYFQWGDTKGYTKDQIGTGDGHKKFAEDWSDYKLRLSGDNNVNVAFTKYTRSDTALNLEDDAAHANMGGSWHMPTPAQIQELINTANTTNTWTTQDGVNGRLFTSTKDASKSIFIPAAGYAMDGSFYHVGGNGYVWSSRLSMYYATYGIYLDFGSGYASLGNDVRYKGRSVRGVIG